MLGRIFTRRGNLLLVLGPHLVLLLDNRSDQLLEKMFKLAQIEEKADHVFLFNDALDDFSILLVARVLMKHDPSDRGVRVSQSSQKLLHVRQGLFLLELAFDDVPLQFLAISPKAFKALSTEEFDPACDNIIFEGFLGGRETFPKGNQINQLTSIQGNDPIVREMLVADFTHLSFALVEDTGYEGQDGEDDGSLSREGA